MRSKLMIVTGLLLAGWLWHSPSQTEQESKALGTKSFAKAEQIKESSSVLDFASSASESHPKHDHRHEPGHDCEESRRFAAEMAEESDEAPMSSAELLQREMGTDWQQHFALTEQDFVGTDGQPLDYSAFLREQDEQALKNSNLQMDSLAAQAGR